MNKEYIAAILERVKNSEISVDEAVETLRHIHFEDIGFAKLDNHREMRTGYPEIIFCPGKKDEHLLAIIETLLKRKNNIIATRASAEQFKTVKQKFSDAEFYAEAKIIFIKQKEIAVTKKHLLILAAGTSDGAVAEEAYVTAQLLGTRAKRIDDVGVAGVHRLLAHQGELNEASVIIAVAGMEGALASVVGGLVDKPVIAVPTSIGYGANFEGIAPLLTMLNSCASGVSVVNIDNGFGAAFCASQIIRQIEKG